MSLDNSPHLIKVLLYIPYYTNIKRYTFNVNKITQTQLTRMLEKIHLTDH